MAAVSRPVTWQSRVHRALRHVPTWTVYLACMVPAAIDFALAFSGRQGADPTRALEHGLGIWALRLLIAGLVITPLRQIAGLNLVLFRRVIGLAAFTYVVLHLGVYVVLDLELNLDLLTRDLTRRPYIIVGMIGFLALVPLAITSTNAMIRRMGPRAWNRLHRLVYLAALLGAVHFVMVVKSWPPEPLIHLAIVVVLVGWRLLPAGSPPPARAAS